MYGIIYKTTYLPTGEVYISQKEAAEKNKTTAAKISTAVNHGTKIHGLHFELVEGGGC